MFLINLDHINDKKNHQNLITDKFQHMSFNLYIDLSVLNQTNAIKLSLNDVKMHL